MDLNTSMEFEKRFDEVVEGLLAPSTDDWKSMTLAHQIDYAQTVATAQIARKLEHILRRMSNL